MNAKVRKALAYITREREGKRQLLVFTHPHSPEAGLQVPAGTIETDEEPEAAVLREAFEETGLSNLEIVRKLGIFDYFYAETGAVHERHVFHLRLVGTSAERWEWIETGGGLVPESEGHLFAFYWTNLDGLIDLTGDQGAYLSHLVY
jgi:8-oxo-dGTP pyrophosphatase MutT (NUDIX family)